MLKKDKSLIVISVHAGRLILSSFLSNIALGVVDSTNNARERNIRNKD